MLIKTLLAYFRRFWLFSIVEEGGGAVDAPADTGGEAAAPAAEAPAEVSKPTSMLEAINQALDGPSEPAAESGQPRDEKGRFAAQKAEAEAAAAAAQGGAPGAKPAADPAKAKPEPQKPETPEDLLQMPEGLKPDSQRRFQKLVETNKELSTKVEQAEQQVGYIRETFQRHNVTQPQFEQAVAFIGAVNGGNLEQALRILDAQRAELALALGKPLPGVDVLSEHPDLRQSVDAMQMTEAHAIELARRRRDEIVARQNYETQHRAQQEQQVAQQARDRGLTDIDAFCKQMQASDLDYALIEERLLPEIGNLIRGVPPQQWKATIETNYRLLKNAVAGARSTMPAAATGTVLRPTGAASPAAKPGSLYEAMWGAKAPA